MRKMHGDAGTLSEEHKNKRRKLKQLELGQMMRGAPDKDG